MLSEVPTVEAAAVDASTLEQLRRIMESKWLWGIYLALAMLIPIFYALWFRYSGRRGPEQSLPERLRDVAMILRGRAFRLRLWSGIFLYASVLVLFCGLYFVVFVAKELVENDSPYLVKLNDRQDKARKERSVLQGEVDALRDSLRSALLKGGGKAWFVPSSIASNSQLTRVHFTDKKFGWIVGYGKTDKGQWYPLLFESDDSGFTWNSSELPDALNVGSLHDIRFVPSPGAKPKIGWAVGHERTENRFGRPVILKTSDGGASWQRQAIPDAIANGRLTRIEIPDGGPGWAVGYELVQGIHKPLILKTQGGDQEWEAQGLPDGLERGWLADIQVIDNRRITAVGVDQTPGGDPKKPRRSLILSTSDAGATPWVRGQLPDIPQSSWLKGVTFNSTKQGVAVGGEFKAPNWWPLILITSDGGKSWRKPGSEFTNDTSLQTAELQGIVFRNREKGWAVGKIGKNQPLVLTTDDGGRKWQRQKLPETTSGNLSDVFFIDQETGWSVGYDRNSEDPLLLATRIFDHDIASKQSVGEILTYLNTDAPRHIADEFRAEAARLSEKLSTADQQINDHDEFIKRMMNLTEPGTIQYGPLLTRVTALVLIFLLVNLMVRLYQYNNRLAAFYDARADALLLSKDQEAAFKDLSLNDLIIGLSPDKHDYAAMPKSPMEQVTEVAKTVAARPG